MSKPIPEQESSLWEKMLGQIFHKIWLAAKRRCEFYKQTEQWFSFDRNTHIKGACCSNVMKVFIMKSPTA